MTWEVFDNLTGSKMRTYAATRLRAARDLVSTLNQLNGMERYTVRAAGQSRDPAPVPGSPLACGAL